MNATFEIKKKNKKISMYARPGNNQKLVQTILYRINWNWL